MMMFRKVRAIALHTLSSLDIANACHMAPLPTVLALWHSRTHVCTIDRCNIASYIESSIDNSLGILSHLGVPDVDSYNSYV